MINYEYLNELIKVWIGVGVFFIILISLIFIISIVLFFIYLCKEDDKLFTAKVKNIIKLESKNGSTNTKK